MDLASLVERQQHWRFAAMLHDSGVDLANLVSTPQLAEELGLPVRTVQRMAQAGEIPVWLHQPRRLIFDRRAVTQALQSRR